MKIAFVNHVHPDAPHVSALRMRKFADGLAALGDHVVLLTGTLGPDDPGTGPGDLKALIAGHDRTRTLHIPVRPAATPLRRAARDGRLATPLRQAVIGTSYLWRNGIFGDWRSGAGILLPAVAEAFAPDVVYGTFGNTDSWAIARDLAMQAGCPWVADYKDPWDEFVPAGVRRIVAGRFTDMAGMTAFSESHARHARNWFSCETQVVYSGYPEPDGPAPGPVVPDIPPATKICLSGSLYRADHVTMLLWGLAQASVAEELILSYAGNDGEIFRKAAAAAGGSLPVKDHGYLDGDALFALQRGAAANVYIRSEKALFQQKPIELLAVGKPVLSFPDEGAEAARIAGEVGGVLLRCGTSEEVAAAIENLPAPSIDAGRMDAYSWAAQTRILRDFLSRAAGRSP